VDIDGTLCSTPAADYAAASPIPEAVAAINRLYERGHRIILLTARGTVTGIDWRSLTERQLLEWGVRYHELVFGKPAADVYIDDKAISTAEWKGAGYQIGPPLHATA
jgi:dTDP-glucose 4,6-dehydratase